MKEFEVKILEINKEEIITKILNLGGIKNFEGEIFNEFFINQEGKKLRLRKLGNKFFLTYKNKLLNNNSMENEEYEIQIDNYETCKNILENLGFKQYGKSEKIRIEYQLGNIKFELDKYEGIPRFVEIESNNENDLNKGIQLLGFSINDTCKLTERPLKEKYGII